MSSAKSKNVDSKFQNLVAQPMTLPQKKALLKQLQTPEVISSLRRPEILMDFFTDCLNTGDLSLAVPALSGLYHLITLRNLDYPSFYTRLYALLDKDVLHSKYRSRILRHLDIFLAPTNHLPASTLASFIKRLSRLCLYGPPSAIVAIVPFIYNLLKSHPTCTFMIHRHPYPPYTKTKDNLGVDPYNASETNPQLTNAIDSSLWELDTLRSHYHPTVASIARIISEQFTKQQYNLEDFLDHGYGTLMEAELGSVEKEVEGVETSKKRKAAVVEYKIPKRIFVREQEVGAADEKEQSNLLLDLWSF